jgi:hypothetical protein
MREKLMGMQQEGCNDSDRVEPEEKRENPVALTLCPTDITH